MTNRRCSHGGRSSSKAGRRRPQPPDRRTGGWKKRRSAELPCHDGPVSSLQLGKCSPDRFPESSDMLLYLAGVNEHAVLRIVASKRWSVAHFLRTIQYLFEYGVRFLAT